MRVFWRRAPRRIRGRRSCCLGVLLAVAGVTLSAAPSMAGKEVFKESKPHVNVGTLDGYHSGDERELDGANDLKLSGPDEPRYPPAAAWMSRGTVYAQGTQDNDYLLVDVVGWSVEVTINDNTNPLAPVELYFQAFDAAEVYDVRMYGLAGKDVLENSTAIPDVIFGGLGNDDILAGNGITYAFGQEGEDIINGNGGNDFLYGDEDTDYVFGGAGSDYVEGNDGVDLVSGGYSDGTSDDVVDMLLGGAGGDYFIDPPPELTADILADFDPMEDGYW